MLHNALEWHVSVQMNVTRTGLCGIWLFDKCFLTVRFCDMLLRVWSCGVFAGYINDGTAAGINREATEKGPHNLRI